MREKEREEREKRVKSKEDIEKKGNPEGLRG